MKVKKKMKSDLFKNDKSTYYKIGIILGIVLVIYLLGSLFFRSHFYIRSKVNGVDASMKNAESTYAKIVNSADKYTISFVDNDGEVINEIGRAHV